MKFLSLPVLLCTLIPQYLYAEQPVGIEDIYSVRSGVTLNVNSWNGVLSNDYDPDNDDISVGSFESPHQGTLLMLLTNGAFSYKAPSGFTGTDSFTYRVWDGSHYSPEVTVTIHILENFNNSPVAVSEEYQTGVNRNLRVNEPGLLENDYDPEQEAISVSDYLPPMHGRLSSILSSGAFIYEPDSGFSGTDFFSYRITDGDTDSEYMPVIIKVGDGTSHNIVVNGSFDIFSDGLPEIASSWKARKLSGEKRVCDELNSKVAMDGSCAFLFEGGQGESSKLQQLIYSTSALQKGDVARLEMFVRGEDLAHGAIVKAVISYQNNQGKDVMRIKIPAGSYPYSMLQSKKVILRGAVSFIKVQITNRAHSGSFLLDRVRLSVE